MALGSELQFVLRVYISGKCPLARFVDEATSAVERELPRVRIELIDIDAPEGPVPEFVFSVPTYTLNGRIVSLGNPDSGFVNTLRALIERERSSTLRP